MIAYNSEKILFIDDDRNFRQVLALALREKGYKVETAANGAEGLEKLDKSSFALILCDLKMPVLDGMGFLEEAGKRGITTPLIVITAYGSIESAVDAMRAGAFDYITKPVNRDALDIAIKRALDHARLIRENRQLREHVSAGRAVDRLIGQSSAMSGLRETLLRLAESDVTVLIYGESGVGKELVARALHFDGLRAAAGRFVVLNCAAIPADLLESELFGHAKGAFTGAVAERMGKFEAAHGGTLFLDEIGDMPLPLQTKLLRTLQEGESERLGENLPRKINVRVVAATNQLLEEKVKEGSFRQDLYYRLAVVPVHIPPLRAHSEDIVPLTRHFLARYGSPGAEISAEAMDALKSHSWPGNVRELENIIQRACALKPGLKVLEESDLPTLTQSSGAISPSAIIDQEELQLPESGINFEALEQKILEAAWEKSGHNQSAGARLVGLPRQAFIYRLQKYGIIPEYGAQTGRDPAR